MPELEFQAPGAVTTWFRDKRTKLLECFAEKRACRPPETVHAAWRGVLAKELVREPRSAGRVVDRRPRRSTRTIFNDLLEEALKRVLADEPVVQSLEDGVRQFLGLFV